MSALDSVSGALDAYSWLFQQKILSPHAFYSGTEPFAKRLEEEDGRKRRFTTGHHVDSRQSTEIFSAIRTIIEKCLFTSEARDYEGDLGLLAPEATTLRHKNAATLRAILDFLDLLLESDKQEFARLLTQAPGVWSPHFHMVLLRASLCPWENGTMNKPEEDEEVEQFLKIAFSRMVRHWEVLDDQVTPHEDRLVSAVRRQLEDSTGPFNPFRLAEGLPGCDTTARYQLISAYDALLKAGLLPRVLSVPEDVWAELRSKGSKINDAVEALASHLALKVASLPLELSPSSQRLASSILLLAINMGVPVISSGPTSLLSLMHLNYDVPGTTMTQGQLFQRRFHAELADAMLGSNNRPLLAELTHQPDATTLFMKLVEHQLSQPLVQEEAVVELLRLAESNENLVNPWGTSALKDEVGMQAIAVLERLLRLEALLPRSRRVGLHKADWVCGLFQRSLQTTAAAASVKAQCLKLCRFLLPSYIADAPVPHDASSSGEAWVRELVSSIRDGVIATHFPLGGSRELKDTQPVLHTEYRMVLNAIIDAVSATANVQLLVALVQHFKEGRAHVFYRALERGLRSLVINMRGADPQASIAFAHEVIGALQGKSLVDYKRKGVVLDLVLVPFISSLPLDVLEAFFIETMPNSSPPQPLIQSLASALPERLTASSVTDNGLFDILYNMEVLRILYQRLPRERVRGRINTVFTGEGGFAKGTELLTAVAKRARNAYRTKERGTASKDMRLRFCSAAFNCVAAVVLKTQDKSQHIENFLLKPESDMDFFENLVDVDKVYQFRGDDVDTVIRDAGKYHTNRLLDAGQDIDVDFTFRYQIGTTQAWGVTMLNKSSLSQSTSQVVVTDEGFQEAMREKEKSLSQRGPSYLLVDDELEAGGEDASDMSSTRNEAGWKLTALLRELRDFNALPCMAAMIELVKRLRELMPGSDEDHSSEPIPEWVDLLAEKIENRDANTKPNVRLFVLQLFLNKPVSEVLAPWCSTLGDIVLKASLELFFYGHNGLHYFLLDVARLFLSDWAAYRPSRASKQAARFLSGIIGRLHSNSQPVLRRHMGCADGLIKAWIRGHRSMTNGFVAELNASGTISKILDLLAVEQGMTGGSHATPASQGVQGKRKALTALNTLAILLMAGVNLMSVESQDADRLCSLVVRAIDKGSKEVFTLGAETCGLILQTMEKQQAGDEMTEFSTEASQLALKAQGVLKKCDSKEKFLLCVRGIARYYPGIITGHLFDALVSAMVHTRIMDGVAKAGILHLLKSLPYALEQDNLYGQLKPTLHQCITDTSRQYINRTWMPYVQLRALELLHFLLGRMDTERLCQTVKGLLQKDDSYNLVRLATSQSTDTACRRELYQMLIMIYLKVQRTKTSGSGGSLMGNEDSWEALRWCLIAGLEDPDDVGVDDPPSTNAEEKPDAGVRKRLLDFWDSEAMLPFEPVERLERLFTDLFHPDCANAWLGAAAYLFLSLAAKADGYDRKLFPRPLSSECLFQGMNLTVADGRQGSVMTPLFSLSRTQPSQSLSQDGFIGTQSVDVSQIRAGQIRATQTGSEWTQTQGVGDPFAGMHGTSQVSERPPHNCEV